MAMWRVCAILVFLLVGWPISAVGSDATRVTSGLPDPVPCTGCWRPALRSTWQWHLDTTTLEPPFLDVDVYFIAFDVPVAIVRQLKAHPGRRLVCYISAGSWEPSRSDQDQYPKRLLGSTMQGEVHKHWSSERWVDVRDIRKPDSVLADILRARMNICAAKGFDGVEFDNVMTFDEDHEDFSVQDGAFGGGEPGKISAEDQLYFNIWLANEAHRRKLSAGLKNNVVQLSRLLPYFEWALNEECFDPLDDDGKPLGKPECFAKDNGGSGYDQFVAAGKAVFGVTYPHVNSSEPFDEWALRKGRDVCPKANAAKFNWILKEPTLGTQMCACEPGKDTCSLAPTGDEPAD